MGEKGRDKRYVVYEVIYVAWNDSRLEVTYDCYSELKT